MPALLQPPAARAAQQQPTEARPEWKREADLMAVAALAGLRVIKSTTDAGRPCWVATRWALSRELHSLDDLARWLETVTGRRV